MLVAETSIERKRIYLSDPYWTKERLVQLKKETTFICPICQTEVQLKVGETRIPHFAHLKSCPVQGEKESLYHMDGKLQLFNYLKQNDLSLQLEKYFPSIKQRTDLYIESATNRYCLEYQCAKISEEEMTIRTRGYQSIDLYPLWILGGLRLKRVKTFEYRFNNFIWRFLQTNTNDHPYLIAFCSKLKTFILLHSIVPFSKQMVFAETTLIRPEHLPFHQLVNPSSQKWNVQSFHKQWFIKRDRFREIPKVHLTKQEKMLQALLYEKFGISLSQIPAEAFIPLKNGWKLKDAVYVWQTLVLYCLSFIAKGESFHLQRVLWLVRQCGGLSCRLAERDEKFTVQTVVQSYLNKLADYGYLEKEGRDYYKQNQYDFFRTSQEALRKRDKQLESFYRVKRKV